jgi:ATP-dependent exoDNAse (exonuclease V) beta subunit
MTGLTFEGGKKHQYALNGRPIPSVTQIIRRVLGDKEYGGTQWHMDRGTAAHELYAMLARGEDLSKYDYDQRLQPNVDAWRDWAARERPKFIEVEYQVASDRFGYAGTIDAVVQIGKRVFILDYKATSSARDAIQLAAYRMALRETMPELIVTGLISLQINADGWRYGPVLGHSEMLCADAAWNNVLGVYRLLEKEV